MHRGKLIVREKFIEWMHSQKKSDGKAYEETTINRYVKALERTSAQIRDLNIESTNLFFYKDLETFKEIDRIIRQNNDFERVNRASGNGNGDLSASMTKYLKFLEDELNVESIDQINDHNGEEKLMLSIKDMIGQINTYIESKGFSYGNSMVENFYLCLKTKPFVLLAGTSGTGKTRLVRLFAEAIGAFTDDRYLQVAVKPDWSDSTDLFGHVNLDNEFVPGSIIEFIKKASDDKKNLPYILCFEEMNLARVEYYMSDFLSIIETRDWNNESIKTDKLVPKICYAGNDKATKEYANLILPENLYIVGTVNMDETTFPFSKKVLDRANTIEFSYVKFDLPDIVEEQVAEPIKVYNDFLRADFLRLRTDCAEQWETVKKYNDKLKEINEILKQGDAHFGYRIRDEIIFYMLYREKADILSENEAFDNQIMQKILPRIQGSSETIATILREMFKVCAGPYVNKNGSTDSEKMKSYMTEKGNPINYPRSAEKIWKMIRRFEDDDFTSYWV